MLTAAEQEEIRANGLATMHDYRIVSLLSGEPFFEEGILLYCDGRTLLLCAQPLRNRAATRPVAVRRVLRKWLAAMPVDMVFYVGPSPVALPCLIDDGFIPVEIHRRMRRSSELFLPVRNEYERTRVFRRAISNGFSARVLPGGLLRREVISIAETFFRSLPMNAYVAELAMTLPAALTYPTTAIIEAWEDDSIRGFVAVHEPFEDVCVALAIAHDRITRGVSDFLYAQMISHARASGATYVNVGPSPSAGHLRFKEKWRGVPLVPPYYLSRWIRTTQADREHNSWLPRILGMA